jgi:hypothetical protein
MEGTKSSIFSFSVAFGGAGEWITGVEAPVSRDGSTLNLGTTEGEAMDELDEISSSKGSNGFSFSLATTKSTVGTEESEEEGGV